ncbi:hypothetical protein PoB_006522600 [Plakobranchus ocellatus]|uniref:Uncharacterized protein n=1 Tax=Plakobranchus ocellatus TaxID=259542 RepID=A0AAV4D3R6_9GAST|nr:hypothetical protein PoB_006522600 [Plakobranchus ocellatus]
MHPRDLSACNMPPSGVNAARAATIAEQTHGCVSTRAKRCSMPKRRPELTFEVRGHRDLTKSAKKMVTEDPYQDDPRLLDSSSDRSASDGLEPATEESLVSSGQVNLQLGLQACSGHLELSPGFTDLSQESHWERLVGLTGRKDCRTGSPRRRVESLG